MAFQEGWAGNKIDMAAHKDRLRVLLISDKSIDREGYKTLQKQTKFKIVSEARSVAEALRILDDVTPDLIVFENGPRSKTIESVRRLKKSYPDLPIVIMSSQAEEVFIAGTVKAGASGYIIKQNIAQELIDAVAKIERGQIYLSPLISRSISMILDMERSPRMPMGRGSVDLGLDSEELTDRQKEILKLLVQGLTNKQVAQRLKLSVKTVDAHRANIMNKLRIHGLPGLVKYAIRTGLTTIEEL
jgi:DNA-binding NarL/FixJ family response regulator